MQLYDIIERVEDKELIFENSEPSEIKTKIFKTSKYNSVAVVESNQKGVAILQSELKLDAEMLAHTPLSTFKDSKDILILESINTQIIKEIEKHPHNRVDFIQNSDSVLELIERLDGKKFTNYKKSPSSKYSIIIYDGALEFCDYEKFREFLDDDGVLIFKTKNLILERENLEKISKDFYIFLPFYFHYSTFRDKNYIFASKKNHPEADIITQRSDLLEDISYYSSDIHLSSFKIPKFLKDRFKGVFKY